MKILTISNLYPRPDQPQRGLFNAQQFRAMAALEHGRKAEGGRGGKTGGERGSGDQCSVVGDQYPGTGKALSIVSRQSALVNLCLVPEWRVWRWPAIRRWKDPFQERCETRYVPVFYVPVLGRNWMWWSYRLALDAEAGSFAWCDAVLATWLYPDGVAATEIGRRMGKPVWIKVHGTDRFHAQASGRRARVLAACRHAAGVICVSDNVAVTLRAAGVEPCKIKVVPNGVDPEQFRFRTRGEAWELLGMKDVDPHGPMVLYVGNLSAIKGPDVLLEAWARVKQASGLERARLMFIGEGAMQRVLRQQSARLGLADSVDFAGTLPHEQVALWMNAADCLCLPSRSEGMPNVIIEARAAGLPVVATRVGACAELLSGCEGSRLVSLDEAQDHGTGRGGGGGGDNLVGRLAGAIVEVLSLKLDRRAIAQASCACLTWAASAERTIGLIAGGGAASHE